MKLHAEIIKEPMSQYNLRRKTHVTSHSLAMFSKDQELYRAYMAGELPDNDSNAFRLGRAFHTLVLEPDLFASLYAVDGVVNPKTGRCYGYDTQKVEEFESQTGKEVLNNEDRRVAFNMLNSVKRHPVAQEIFGAKGEAEATVLATMYGVPCQSRIDWLTDETIVDLKSCDDMDGFVYDARKYRYARQLAFYAYMAMQLGRPMPRAKIVAAEKKPPYRAGVFFLPRQDLEDEIDVVSAEITQLARCIDSGRYECTYQHEQCLER